MVASALCDADVVPHLGSVASSASIIPEAIYPRDHNLQYGYAELVYHWGD